MPGFAQAEGGPLSEAQIASLVKYLSQELALRSNMGSMAHASAAQ